MKKSRKGLDPVRSIGIDCILALNFGYRYFADKQVVVLKLLTGLDKVFKYAIIERR